MKYKLQKPIINRITFEMPVDVYDLSVEDHHSYCVGNDNIIVHNCSTYNQTGFASPMFSCGLDSSILTDIPLIGDGGVSENGDIVKSLVSGYKMVMCGSIFASCIDSPAPLTAEGHKLYFGSASKYNRGNSENSNRFVEGKIVEQPCNNMTYKDKLLEIEDSIKSGLSYAGGSDLSSFNHVKYVSV